MYVFRTIEHFVVSASSQFPEGGPIQARALAARIEAELGLRVHPCSIERAIGRKKTMTASSSRTMPAGAVEAYEALRKAVIEGYFPNRRALRSCVFTACCKGSSCSSRQKHLAGPPVPVGIPPMRPDRTTSSSVSWQPCAVHLFGGVRPGLLNTQDHGRPLEAVESI